MVRHAHLLDQNCAIARSSGIVGERWVWVILRQAFNGARRFEDFQRGIGLARNVLTDRLNLLLWHGLLSGAALRRAPRARSVRVPADREGPRAFSGLCRAYELGRPVDGAARPAGGPVA